MYKRKVVDWLNHTNKKKFLFNSGNKLQIIKYKQVI